MSKKLVVFVMSVLPVVLVATTATAGIIPSPFVPMWRDQFEDPVDAYVEAVRGETVTVYFEINDEFGWWVANERFRAELWWDTAVVVSYGPMANYNYVPDVDSVTSGQYWAAPDYSSPPYAHYTKVDLWYSNMYAYDGLRIVGWDIPIRADAPFGETQIGSCFIGTQGGGITWYETLDDGGQWGLTINVIPEPATMSLLALGGLAALLRRRRK